ncbi:hypothetical protein DUNSADRAFT_2068 [Dunaliella salina]|uniref:Encoded protein n=1 Tax=Dunaliella salina TaxID=3046 RepID=A0ABQ7FWR8_DUNSA|nr:hypothetical protein DUNSADRAFT_2068 [Dunaliella salina]|eukprot:KAF5826781.1 hypothetical protein DUNSADRAFT_2068 [Dunaliella salina]
MLLAGRLSFTDTVPMSWRVQAERAKTQKFTQAELALPPPHEHLVPPSRPLWCAGVGGRRPACRDPEVHAFKGRVFRLNLASPSLNARVQGESEKNKVSFSGFWALAWLSWRAVGHLRHVRL